MYIPLIDKHKYNIYVWRRKPNGVDYWDQATIIEDEDTQEDQLLFKSDGTKVPKPPEEKIGTMQYRSLMDKLTFKKKAYVDATEFIDYGDGNGDFVSIDNADSDSEEQAEMKASGNNRMFETHRNLMSQKYSELFSEEDNTQLWLAGYLTVLALITIGSMWMLTNGMEESIAKGISQGIEAGIEAGGNAQETTG